MWNKTAFIYIKFGGILLLSQLAIYVLLELLFGGSINTLFVMPLILIATWLCCYYGTTQLISRLSEKTPFYLGASISLVSNLAGTLLLLVLTRQFELTLGLVGLIVGGAAGYHASVSKPFGTLSKMLLAGIFSLYGIFLAATLISAYMYKTQDITRKQINGSVRYEDKKFGYAFTYPSNWKNTSYLLSQGEVTVSPDSSATSVTVWYKDSSKINSIDDLEKFVKDDATYAESNQGVKTLSVKKSSINAMPIMIWKGKDKDNNLIDMYYIADYKPTDTQQIYLWTISIINGSGNKDAEDILRSFTLLK